MSLSTDQIRPDRIAIYIRWSTEDQGEGTTLDIQMDACRSFILSQGWKVREDLVFVDDGVSGATIERPALRNLRGLVKQRLVDCVVVYKLDRLSRSVLDMLKLVLEEWDGLCSIKSAREPIDTLTPTGKMFFYQLMSFAEWERAVIRDRMFAGRLRRAHEGKLTGGSLPYGFRKGDGGVVEQDPAAAPVVARIFELYLTGLGCRMISKKLHEEGGSSPMGGQWTEGSLVRILANPAYMGTMVYGKERRVKGKRVAADEPHVVKEGFFPAIVTREQFEAVQQLRVSRPTVGRDAPAGHGRTLGSQNLLTGLLRCTCGRACCGIAPRLHGVQYRYYVCGLAQSTGRHLCNAGNIRQEELDQLVVDQMLAFFRGAEARKRVVEQLVGAMRADYERVRASRLAAEQEVKRLEESERRLKGLMIDGKLSVEEYRGLAGELGTKLTEARRGVKEAVQAEAGAHEALQRDEQNTLLLDRINEWETLDLVEQKQVLRQFIKQITVFRDKATDEVTCEIDWRWEPPVNASLPTVYVPHRKYDGLREVAKQRRRSGGRFVAAARQDT